MDISVGIGYDIHRLATGRGLRIGGVSIPYAKGCLGHSDADVLLHAVCDALLGAAGAGDIGELFPDSDPQYKDVDSRKLLAQVGRLLLERGLRIVNIDAVVIAEEPKLAPFKEKMRMEIAGTLGMAKSQVNVKAKTSEGLGELGRSEAIAAYAVSLVSKGA